MRSLIGDFWQNGSASVIVGGQFGSEAKGCASAWVAAELAKHGQAFDIVTCNAGAQAGHTSIHNGVKKVLFHLPTAAVVARDQLKPDLFSNAAGCAYLNAGSIIDIEMFKKELELYDGDVFIHPNAAVITEDDKEHEGRAASSQTSIASTRKGVGRALARKIERSALTAEDYQFLQPMVRRIDLNRAMTEEDLSVLVEVPQGVSLSLNHSGFYPYTTSRDCTVGSGLSDAGIHPHFLNQTMVVLRTFPIRVGNIVEAGTTLGTSGGVYSDQKEISWEELGVEAEITTVTKRVRRVFTFSYKQIVNTISLCRPDVVFLSFCNYVKTKDKMDEIVSMIKEAVEAAATWEPQIVYQWGPTTDDVGDKYER